MTKGRLEQLKLAKKHLLSAERALEQTNWTSYLQTRVHDVILLVQENIENDEKTKQAGDALSKP